MRFDTQVIYPHPVLRADGSDYADGDFQAVIDCSVSSDQMNVEIRASYDLSVPELVELIESKRAVAGLLVSCRDTFLRKIEPLSNEGESTIRIKGGELHGEVVVVPIVYAVDRVESFGSVDFAEEFAGLKFDLEAGDFLAYEQAEVFYLEREAFEPVESIITLTMDAERDGFEWEVGLDGDQIEIIVSDELGSAIQTARNDTSNRLVLINSLYFAALQTAVESLRDEPDIEHKWANVIRQKCAAKGLPPFKQEEPHVFVQRLLEHPLGKLATEVFSEEA